MELDINKIEEKLFSIVEKAFDEVNEDANKPKGDETPDAPGTQQTTIASPPSTSPQPNGKIIQYPDIKSDFFVNTYTDSTWWNDNKLFVAFGLLVLLAVFVFHKLFCSICNEVFYQGYLIFLFGVISLLFVILGVLAYYIIKDSTKHHTELNERENKQLAFRLKMMEAVFELENRQIIAEKQSMEKEISKNEKDHLYSLDEQQRMAEHHRKMQFRRYELVESYMKHLIELAKSGYMDKENHNEENTSCDVH